LGEWIIESAAMAGAIAASAKGKKRKRGSVSNFRPFESFLFQAFSLFLIKKVYKRLDWAKRNHVKMKKDRTVL
jgi:hypothetical protein